MSTIKQLIKNMGFDESNVQKGKKIKKYNSVKANMIPGEDISFMADLIELPHTSRGFKYLLTVVDLGNDDFDMEPLKTKTPTEVKKGFEKILERPYLSKPFQLITDGGNEFKGEFHNYLKNMKVYHRTSMPYRHTQTANVEALNKQIVRILTAYMNMKEEQTAKIFKNWDEIVDKVRIELNAIRHKELPEFKLPEPIFNAEPQEFHLGDLVHYRLSRPRNALGKTQSTTNFRVGDYYYSKDAKKINNVIVMRDLPRYRYQLVGLPHVAFYAEELQLSSKEEQTFLVKQLIGKKKIDGVVHYLVWWKGYKKNQATWEPEKNLIEDGLTPIIDAYNSVQRA